MMLMPTRFLGAVCILYRRFEIGAAFPTEDLCTGTLRPILFSCTVTPMGLTADYKPCLAARQSHECVRVLKRLDLQILIYEEEYCLFSTKRRAGLAAAAWPTYSYR